MFQRITVITGMLMCCMLLGSSYAGSDKGKDKHRHSSLDFFAVLTGAQEVTNPPGGVDSNKAGTAFVTFDAGFTKARVHVRVNDASNVIAAHFHCGSPGQNGPVKFGLISPGQLMLDGNMINGTLTNTDASGADCMPVVGRPINNIASLALAMRDGLIYINIHTTNFTGGEIRGQMLEKSD